VFGDGVGEGGKGGEGRGGEEGEEGGGGGWLKSLHFIFIFIEAYF
jgi:hypothetical protein